MVICFDANQSPIRNIQRAGRTGRHKEGCVVHILSEGAEEDKYRRHIAVCPGSRSCRATSCFMQANLRVSSRLASIAGEVPMPTNCAPVLIKLRLHRRTRRSCTGCCTGRALSCTRTTRACYRANSIRCSSTSTAPSRRLVKAPHRKLRSGDGEAAVAQRVAGDVPHPALCVSKTADCAHIWHTLQTKQARSGYTRGTCPARMLMDYSLFSGAGEAGQQRRWSQQRG